MRPTNAQEIAFINYLIFKLPAGASVCNHQRPRPVIEVSSVRELS